MLFINRIIVVFKFIFLKKNNRLICTFAYLIICTLLFASCAQVVAPNGGKIDKTPPRVLKYTPDSAQLNFNSKSILIELNEYAQLKDLSTQLIISPPISKTPNVNLKNKSLTITFDKDEILKPNTTYSINFGNALQDITENNPMDNFKYIFSTGNYIDSLSVNGRIKYAFNHKPEKGIMVMLYSKDNAGDSAIYKNQPDYFAKTNEMGAFQINNIRAGTYKIMALKDLNANYKYDNEGEHIAFIDTLIDVSKKIELKMEMFQESPKKVLLKKYSHSSYGKITLFFNQGSDSIRVNLLDNTSKGVQEFFEFSKNKDTLTYWVKNYSKDSLKLQVNNGNEIIDTLDVEMINFEKALKNNRSPFKLNLEQSANGNQNFDLNSELNLAFNNPIASIDGEPKLKIDTIPFSSKEDSLTYNTKLQTVLLSSCCYKVSFEDAENPGIMQSISKTAPFINWKENTNYNLLIPAGTFTDIFGLKNDTLEINFKTREQKYYGTLKLNVSIPEMQGKYIVLLMDEKETVIRETSISKSEILFYEYLLPMKYKLKIIKDENGNGKWDTGNYLKKQHAEKVIYNPELIQIRSNWDADLEWSSTP